MKNWRSSFAGIGAILTVLSRREITELWSQPEDLAIIIAGVGLIFARDAKGESK